MAALYWTIFLTFLALRLLVFRLDETRSYPDTLSYLSLAEAPVVDPSFWAGERPPALPLFYRLLGVTETRVEQAAIAQFVLSVAAWTTLAAVIAARLRTSWLRPPAFGLLLLFALTEDISMWDRLLLSESISLSTLALLLVAWVVLLQPFRANAVASAESL